MECEKKTNQAKKQNKTKQKQNKTKQNKNGMKPWNCSDKIKMPKNAIGFRIKSFIPIENMNIEKLRDTYSKENAFSQVSFK